MKSTDPQSLLRFALRANAIFSAGSGIALLAASGTLGAVLGVEPSWILLAIGASLVVFAVGLFRNSLLDRVPLGEAKVAVALDVAWVAGSAVLLAASILTPWGDAVVAAVGAVVSLFAVLQLLGVQRVALFRAGEHDHVTV